MQCFVTWYHLAPIDDGFLSDMDCSRREINLIFPEFLRMCCQPKGFESQLNLDSQSNSSFGIYSKAPRLRNRFYSFRLKGFL